MMIELTNKTDATINVLAQEPPEMLCGESVL